MSNFPTSLDDNVSLPPVNDDITIIGAEAINALRDSVFNIEENIGIGAAGSVLSIANRIDQALNPDGTIRPSALTSLGLVTLPITDSQISETAQIIETKLKLDHRTQDLFNYIRDLGNNVNTALGWISTTGVKLEPHLAGVVYRHNLNNIDVDADPNNFYKNKFGLLRDNSNAYLVIRDINDELLYHQFADGTPSGPAGLITTHNGGTFPSFYAHTASGIFLNSSRFITIPHTIQDVQKFADFIDASGIFLYGTRIQNLYTNGISRVSRSASLTADGYGQSLVPPTSAIAYLLNTDNSSFPIDDINNGDDIIEFKPSAADMNSNAFDEKFALVKVGDIVRINYGSVDTQFIIKEKKYIQNGLNKKYLVRIAGKNLMYSANATARIDKSLVNSNKFGVLAIAAANNEILETPSLIVGSPRSAQALGVGFNPDHFNNSHYLLYLTIYPTGNPLDGYTVLPAIDVTGNTGSTPGQYTLDDIVETTNNAFRKVNYNYRFIAFSYLGEFGIMLSDPYNNVGFSVVSGVVDNNGFYSESATNINFPNNAVGLFASGTTTPLDPLGFSPLSGNIASPLFQTTYSSAEIALVPTRLFIPLKRNNYYVNGIEKERLNVEDGQVIDGYGDGYWIATVINQNIFPGSTPTGRVQTTYRIPVELDFTQLKAGKTIVIQPLQSGNINNYGRSIIVSATFNCPPNAFTDITVYDSIHGSPNALVTPLPLQTKVALYFGPDSVSFNKENSSDVTSITPFKRHFEVYINEAGDTFTHERGRINISGTTLLVNGTIPLYTSTELSKLNVVKISPKLRGYQVGSIRKITLHMVSYDDLTGNYEGRLAYYDGSSLTKLGPTTFGKKGEIIRFYDETNIDYIDIVFDINNSINNFFDTFIDFQLFPTLSLDDQIMMIGTCQLNDTTNHVDHLKDERQFGNTSEKDLSTSALNFISLPERLLHANGVARGFDLEINLTNPNSNQIYMTGGTALVNGKFVQLNAETVVIPFIQEIYNGVKHNILWALCVNDKSEYQPIPLLDFDLLTNNPQDLFRMFNAFNVINSVIYPLDSTTFSNLINNRKDLTILYIIRSSIETDENGNNPIQSLNVSDARKYVNDGETNFPLKFTIDHAQGNFRSFEAIVNWILYNNSFNGLAFIKDINTTSTSILNLDFQNPVVFDGGGNAQITFNSYTTLGSNLTFKNCTLIFNAETNKGGPVNNLTFENCNIIISSAIDTIFNFSHGSNILIKDSNFTISYRSNSNEQSVFNIKDSTGFKFINSSINCTFNNNPGVFMPGNIFVLKNTPDVVIENSFIVGNFNQAIKNVNSSGLIVKNTTINSSYNPNAGGSPDTFDADADGSPALTYDSTNLVNSGRGYIYSNIIDHLDNILLDSVTFIYAPETPSNDRFSFINFELSTVNSILSNLTIKNCQFKHINISNTIDDIRPATAIINTTPANITAAQPLLVNVNIYNNYCNRNQSIIITSQIDNTGTMIFPGLGAQLCTIANNTCGNIGYWIGSITKYVNISPQINALTDKNSGLYINNNNCHYIFSADHTGKYFSANQTVSGVTINKSQYPSGDVVISHNKTNWIHTGISFEENSSLQITDNALSAYDFAYTLQFGELEAYVGHFYAIAVASNAHTYTPSLFLGDGNNSACLISRNTTTTGYWLSGNNSITYKYLGYIFTQSSSNIINNIFKGIEFGVSTFSAILLSGQNSIVKGNQIFRNGVPIAAYVQFLSFFDDWSGAGAQGIVVDNFFDSFMVDDVTLDEDVVKILGTVDSWIVERNKNQTGYISIPLTNAMAFPYGEYGWQLSGPISTEFSIDIQPEGGIGFPIGNGINRESHDRGYHITTAPSNAASTPAVAALNSRGYKSNVLWMHDGYKDPDTQKSIQRAFGVQKNIDQCLPNNVKLIKVQIGIRSISSPGLETLDNTPGGTDSNIYLFLNKYALTTDYTNLDYFIGTASGLNFDNGDINVVNDSSARNFTVISGGDLNGASDTKIGTIDLLDPSDISSQFVSGKNFGFSISLDVRVKRLIPLTPLTTDRIDLLFSPVLIKYRW